MAYCIYCQTAFNHPVYRNTVCSSCGNELKTCRNCRHFAPGMANDCREPVSEKVLDKDRANFCDWFYPADTLKADTRQNSGADTARRAFDNLFSDD